MEILARAAHEEAHTVLVVAHDPRVMPFADYILHLEDGTVKDREATMEKPPPEALPSQLVGREELVNS
jgi:putative ABC transport system ATP-binding protein